MRVRHLVTAGLLLAALGWARPAGAVLCFMDAMGNGSGKAMFWPTMPIKYMINASAVPAADKASFMTAVKAAFTSWTQIQCTNIQFTDGGETTSVDATGLGAILVHFSDVPSGYAFDTFTVIKTYDPPHIVEALIKLNLNITASGGPYGYAVGTVAKKFDVQTAVKNLLAHVLGFCAEVNASGFCVIPATEWKYEYQNLVISDTFKQGAQITYFKADPASCTKPTTTLPACKTTQPPPPGDGVKKDGGGITPPPGDGPKPSGDGFKPSGDGAKPGADLGGLPPPEDDGCCRVSHASRSGSEALLALLGVGLLLALLRRRR